MHRAGLVVAHASVLTEGLAEHANVIFPAESHAEKEGTVVHPDGRLQRLRTAIAHPGSVRSGWSVIAELAKRAGLDTGVLTSPMAFKQLVQAVPFYRGLTLEEIGGRGVRWQEREAASEFPAASGATIPATSASSPGGLAADRRGRAARRRAGATVTRARNGALRLGTYRSIWAAPEVEISPALKYTVARQQLEFAPEDARAARDRHWRGGRGVAERDALRGDRPRPHRRSGRHGVPGRGHRRRLGQRVHRTGDRGGQAMIALADVNYFEPWWVQIIKSLAIFAVIFGDLARS